MMRCDQVAIVTARLISLEPRAMLARIMAAGGLE
jgi:hypothetical protein